MKTVRLILVLLDLAGYFRDFPALAEVDDVGIRQKVRVAFLGVKDIRQVDTLHTTRYLH